MIPLMSGDVGMVNGGVLMINKILGGLILWSVGVFVLTIYGKLMVRDTWFKSLGMGALIVSLLTILVLSVIYATSLIGT